MRSRRHSLNDCEIYVIIVLIYVVLRAYTVNKVLSTVFYGSNRHCSVAGCSTARTKACAGKSHTGSYANVTVCIGYKSVNCCRTGEIITCVIIILRCSSNRCATSCAFLVKIAVCYKVVAELSELYTTLGVTALCTSHNSRLTCCCTGSSYSCLRLCKLMIAFNCFKYNSIPVVCLKSKACACCLFKVKITAPHCIGSCGSLAAGLFSNLN